MGDTVRPCDREQRSLRPPALQDWLPEGDLAGFILDAGAQMDLGKLERTARTDGWGPAASAPARMVALLLYAYGLGERSSRRLERGGEREAAVLVLAATQRPDPPTLARVRQTHEAAWARRLTQILRLCAELGW